MTLQDTYTTIPVVTTLDNNIQVIIPTIQQGQVLPVRINLSGLRGGPATSTSRGLIRLAGDLGGTADSPTVPGLASKAPLVSPTFTGAVTIPTPVVTSNNNLAASTAFVVSRIATTGLNELADVTLSSPSNGQVLRFNGTAWVNSTVAGTGDLLSSNNLSDVGNRQTALNNLINSSNNIHTTGSIRWSSNYTTVLDFPSASSYRGMVAVANDTGPYYSNGTSWVRIATGNATQLSGLGDVDLTGLNTGASTQYLGYNHLNGKWVPRTLPSVTSTSDVVEGDNLYYTNGRVDARIGLANLGALANVSDTAPTNGQVLGWNGTTWLPTTPTGYTPPVTTKGDLFTYGTSATRLGVGANGQMLVADSTAATGLRWRAPLSLDELADVNTLDAEEGQVLIRGASGWEAGDLGGLAATITNPTVGHVVKWSGTTWVNGALDLEGLGNVEVDPLTLGAGAVLAWDTVDEVWSTGQLPVDTDDLDEGTDNLYYTNARVDTRIGTTSINALADVVVSNPVNGQVLTWSSGNWVNQGAPEFLLTARGDLLSHNGTSTVRLPVGSDGQVLIADSTAARGLRWGTPAGGGGTLAGLGDVVLGSPTNNQVLGYDAGTGKWTPRNPSNTVAINRQPLTGILILTGSSAAYQHLDLNGANRDVMLPSSPTVGMWFRIRNLTPSFNLVVKDPLANAVVLTLGNSTATTMAEFVYDGVGWYYWG